GTWAVARRVDVSDADHLSRNGRARALSNVHPAKPVHAARRQLPPHPTRRHAARLARTFVLHSVRARALPLRLLVVRQDAAQLRRRDLSKLIQATQANRMESGAAHAEVRRARA